VKRTLLLGLFGLASASASSVPYSQPWMQKLPAWTSVVRSCGVPVPLPILAADDFTSTTGGVYNNIVWWGTVTSPAQLQRRWYIATYNDNGFGQPNFGAPLWRTCVVPVAALAGVDCQGMRVYKFGVTLPSSAPMPVIVGKQWLVIAEDDSASIQPGVPDFAWSACQPVQNSPAVQFDNLGIFTQPLLDPCNGGKDDLAFVLS